MLRIKFEAQQYLIRQAEIKLHEDTQILLTEMLRSLSEESFFLIEDYNLNYEFSEYIIKVIITNTDIIFKVKYFDGIIGHQNINELSQIQQKELIDFILSNKFKFIEK